jgi:hypothetical protein
MLEGANKMLALVVGLMIVIFILAAACGSQRSARQHSDNKTPEGGAAEHSGRAAPLNG